MEGSPNTSADIFANSSAETITENEEPKISTISSAMDEEPNESYPPPPVLDEITETSLNNNDASMMVNEFIADSNLPTRICCPFCILDFGFEFILKDHIKKSHARELKALLKHNPSNVNFHQCPFCQAKFYIKEVLPKHVIRKHEICVVNMFSGFSPEKYVYCRFCPHKSLRKHYKLLMIHIEQKHFKLFEKFIVSKYTEIVKSFEDIINIENGNLNNESNSPGLSNRLVNLTTKDKIVNKKSPLIKSILKPTTAYPIDSSECIYRSPEPGIYENLNTIKRKARRTLRFDLPDSPDQENKENTPKKQKLSRGKWKFMKTKGVQLLESNNNKNSSKSNEESTMNTSPRCFYMCALCSEAFDMNVKLLEHLRRKHKGIKLQAQYKCGECKAKFFRNSFLVRHCWFHHGPLCLKSHAF
ncbi:hypothetical protein O3M35_012935 [Rhynocoris fuscipes]|uniref:C2H2-type domain-containing protein n=1 Tax=Rhynocoris fuscipes TaxID=488301 RepID=A0AAW1CFI4_9HEMI